jgi:CubicO group peptidase (beta-lactamase class C family)
VLIARASGKTLEAFLRERLFTPLGMKDSAFSVPETKLDRLATCYRYDPATSSLARRRWCSRSTGSPARWSAGAAPMPRRSAECVQEYLGGRW